MYKGMQKGRQEKKERKQVRGRERKSVQRNTNTMLVPVLYFVFTLQKLTKCDEFQDYLNSYEPLGSSSQCVMPLQNEVEEYFYPLWNANGTESIVVLSNRASVGTVIQLRCKNDNFSISNGNGRLVCGSNGKWIPNPSHCKKPVNRNSARRPGQIISSAPTIPIEEINFDNQQVKNCFMPKTYNGSYIRWRDGIKRYLTGSYIRPGLEVVLECKNNFVSTNIGVEPSLCLQNGTFLPELPQCLDEADISNSTINETLPGGIESEKKFCSLPEIPAFGEFRQRNNDVVNAGTLLVPGLTMFLACTDGWLPDSVEPLSCLQNGTWSAQVGNCTIRMSSQRFGTNGTGCGMLPMIGDGHYSDGLFEVGSKRIIHCNEGAKITGPEMVKCCKSNRWSEAGYCGHGEKPPIRNPDDWPTETINRWRKVTFMCPEDMANAKSLFNFIKKKK